MNNQLYEWKDGNEVTKYGTKAGTNSAGKWIMEEKGTGNIVAVDKSAVSAVLPYSVGVRFQTNGASEKIYHYWSEAGKFEKGDLIYLNNSFATITAVDTKNKSANKGLDCIS